MEDILTSEFILKACLVVISFLLSALLYFVRAGIKGIFLRLDKLETQHLVCAREFANANDNKEEHNRIFSQIDNHDKRITTLETRVSITRERV